MITALGRAQDVPVATTAPSSHELSLRRTVTVDVVARTKDAVVYISTTKLARTSPFGDDPFFRQFFQQNVQVQSLGSGFVIHEDGYVVTNNHVIDRAREITVDLSDGRKLSAELIATDTEADLAILKIHSDKPLPYLELGDSSDLMIGEPVIAVGNPLGYSHSVSTGIVSAVHRDLGDPSINLKDLIQTDAAINPGNSGGPLLNAYGQVIGINTAIRANAQNIGFAIQVNRLRELIPSLMNPAQATKVDVPVKLTEQRRLSPPAKVECFVLMAEEGKPATPITAINGHAPRNIVDAYVQLLKVQADQKVTLEFGKDPARQFTAKSVAPPDAVAQARKLLGIGVEELTPLLSEKYGIPVEDGMLVKEVLRDTPAARAGLRPGDVIVGLGNYRVETMKDFATLLQYLPPAGSRVRVEVVRGNQQGGLMLRM
jgi:serine protease Do